MPTYIYECEVHKEFEADHKMSEKLEVCPICQKEGIKSQPPKRLIGRTNFVLVGSGWAKDNYKG